MGPQRCRRLIPSQHIYSGGFVGPIRSDILDGVITSYSTPVGCGDIFCANLAHPEDRATGWSSSIPYPREVPHRIYIHERRIRAGGPGGSHDLYCILVRGPKPSDKSTDKLTTGSHSGN